jgi:hypothetical protein
MKRDKRDSVTNALQSRKNVFFFFFDSDKRIAML